MDFNENVERLKKIVKRCEECKFAACEQCEISWSDVRAISIVLQNLDAICDMYNSAEKDIKRQKQINEEHQKENGLLREKVKELEEENLHWRGQYHLITRKIDIIPKQKIKDKMKKYEWAIKCYDSSIADYKQSQTVGKWAALQELLQESEDK